MNEGIKELKNKLEKIGDEYVSIGIDSNGIMINHIVHGYGINIEEDDIMIYDDNFHASLPVDDQTKCVKSCFSLGYIIVGKGFQLHIDWLGT